MFGMQFCLINVLLCDHDKAHNSFLLFPCSGADPEWSVRGGVEAKIGRKGANFARFWPILEGAALPRPLSGSATVVFQGLYKRKHAQKFLSQLTVLI